MKRLIVCLDGTWNTPDDKKHATNVVKIMRAIRHTGADGTKQITFYDKGVGTGGLCDKVLGGAFGTGLEDNVKDGYRFLANNYEPGDEIYIFGFSRGAFTARSLAGFIGACGLLNKQTMGKLKIAWALYRTLPAQRDPAALDDIRKQGSFGMRISCVGVWDTVGARGIPVESLKPLQRGKYQFHDTTLGERIDCALHAVAIDEKRGPFGPTLWQAGTLREGQVVEQVWFPGVHSNIGGSYDDPRLSDLALDWMIRRVRTHTLLDFDDSYIAEHVRGDAMGTLYESRTLLYAYSRLMPFRRVIGGIDGWVGRVARRVRRVNLAEPGHRFVNEMIHRSAVDRFGKAAPFQKRAPATDTLYEPRNLKEALGHLPVVGYDGEPED